MQHLAENTERTKLAQREQLPLSILVESQRVSSPVQSVVQGNTQVSAVLHPLHLFSRDGNRMMEIILSQFFCFLYTLFCNQLYFARGYG